VSRACMIDWIKTRRGFAAAVVIFVTMVACWDGERLGASAGAGGCTAAAMICNVSGSNRVQVVREGRRSSWQRPNANIE
jgi:hypothetical protein